jgi:hypothetical protein
LLDPIQIEIASQIDTTRDLNGQVSGTQKEPGACLRAPEHFCQALDPKLLAVVAREDRLKGDLVLSKQLN